MATMVARRAARRKAAAVSAERRRAVQRQVRRQLQAELEHAVRLAVEGALRAEVTELLGREKYERRSEAGHTPTRARCSRCRADWPAAASDIPEAHTGAYVERGGVAVLDKGERVQTAEQQRSGTTITNNVHVYGVGMDEVSSEVGRRLRREMMLERLGLR